MYKEPIVVVLPNSEPVSLEEVALHVKQDSSDDDVSLESWIIAAREVVEAHTGRALISRTLQLSLDGFYSSCIRLPYAPLVQVNSVLYYDEDDNEFTLDPASYQVDTVAEPGAIVQKRGYTWPTLTLRPRNGVVIEYVAGYGEADQVPQIFKQAILMLIKHWDRNRDTRELASGFSNLLALQNVYA